MYHVLSVLIHVSGPQCAYTCIRSLICLYMYHVLNVLYTQCAYTRIRSLMCLYMYQALNVLYIYHVLSVLIHVSGPLMCSYMFQVLIVLIHVSCMYHPRSLQCAYTCIRSLVSLYVYQVLSVLIYVSRPQCAYTGIMYVPSQRSFKCTYIYRQHVLSVLIHISSMYHPKSLVLAT